MTILRYPCLIGSVWRWSETNIASSHDMHAVSPCCAKECNGHRTMLAAVLHHASHFCSTAKVLYSEAEERHQCLKCCEWTNTRVMYQGCPYQDKLVMCGKCDAADPLRNNHYHRRGISDYRHIVLPVLREYGSSASKPVRVPDVLEEAKATERAQ